MDTFKRHLISAGITFLSSFIGVMVVIFDGATTFSDLSLKALVLAGMFAGIRAVLKFLNELLNKKL